MIRFGPDVLKDFAESSSREWLETNGIGGFACGSIGGAHTRRYHGLLTAATQPPAGRMVLLSKLEETVILNGARLDLSTNQYPGVVHPRGVELLEEFRLDPFPVWTFALPGGARLEKSVFMVQDENTVAIRYRFLKPPPEGTSLEIRPLIAFRDYHGLTHENAALDPAVHTNTSDTLITFSPYPGLPPLHLSHNAESLKAEGSWYRSFEYAIERERGLDFREDLFNPLTLRFEWNGRKTASILASTEVRQISDMENLRKREIERRVQVRRAAPVRDAFVADLTAAADQYIVKRGDHKTIIAGYPWFTDWGRDTMIALPGLTLVTGRYDVARDILLEFAKHVDQGMLPNRFPDGGGLPEYNNIDGTLWYFEAVRAFLAYTRDVRFVIDRLYPVLSDIVDWHVRGTRYGIHVDLDGLLESTDASVQLTWMDAKIGDWVVTPRNGKAVEIQALWYNALRVMEDLAKRAARPDAVAGYRAMAENARSGFLTKFWNDAGGYLFDTVGSSGADPTIRPNQVLAVSLHHSMVPDDKAASLLKVVEEHLFTPYGLRSLSPADPRYRGRYEGDGVARDSAYHQGPAWGWLLGPYFSALFRVRGNGPVVRKDVHRNLSMLQEHLETAGLGQISEIFDGDTPHHPRGCFAQAWSVAEVLRTVVEDRYGKRPKPLSVAARPAVSPKKGGGPELVRTAKG